MHCPACNASVVEGAQKCPVGGYLLVSNPPAGGGTTGVPGGGGATGGHVIAGSYGVNWYFEVLRKYAVFSGRAHRKEYWMFYLINVPIMLALIFLDAALGGSGIVVNLYSLAVLIPGIAVGVRRMHDTNRSGWD